MVPIRPLKRSYIVPHNRGSLGILFPAEHRHVGGVMCKNDIPVVRTGHFRVATRSAHNHAITPACRDKISQQRSIKPVAGSSPHLRGTRETDSCLTD